MTAFANFLAGLLIIGAGTAHATNLMKDGGFETPATPSGTYTAYAPGQTIGKWTVVGPGNVATVNDYNEGGVLWSPHKGHAFLDLTGTCDCGVASGVSQTVKTRVGASYKLTFWVGNTVIPNQGNTSTVDVYSGSTLLTVAENRAGTGGAKEVWRKFSLVYTANSASTVFSFLNGDPNGDEQNGLDDITLIEQ